jgi:uncharacterized protein (DUF2141 family)
MAITGTLVAQNVANASVIPHKIDVTIRIENIATTNGQIGVALVDFALDSQDIFESNSQGIEYTPYRGYYITPQVGNVTANIPELTTGNYSFIVIHDIDDNDRLNANSSGNPTEPYVFSNNLIATPNPLSFDDIMIYISSTSNHFEVTLQDH